MAKEFDIYLHKRLTECDIIVYSIPFRDGLTAMNRLILESCLESYILQKFVAVQTGSELVTHIDEMIKTCYERLSLGVEIDAEAEFQVLYSLYPEMSGFVIDADKMNHMATMFTDAEDAVQIAAAPLRVGIAKSGGSGRSDIEIDSAVRDTLKNSILTARTGLQIGANVSDTNKLGIVRADANIVPSAELTNLCYRVYRAADSVIQFAADVIETEIHFSLGSGQSDIVIDSEVTGTISQKYEPFQNTVLMIAELTDKLIQFIKPERHTIYITAGVSAIVKRHRLLEEMDDDTLSSYDDMTLEDIDYVIL